MSGSWYFVALLLAGVLLLGLFATLASAAGKRSGALRARPMMTANELAFWRLLVEAARPLHVAPQVAMAAILDVDASLDRKQKYAQRNRFAQKVIDFVLFDHDGRVTLLVELDDRSHESKRDNARDAMTAEAGYRTLRVRRTQADSVERLSHLLAEYLTVPDDGVANSASGKVAQLARLGGRVKPGV